MLCINSVLPPLTLTEIAQYIISESVGKISQKYQKLEIEII